MTTAYLLTQRGHHVSLVDREAVPGSVSSYMNGGQFSYSYAEPLASPAMLRQLPNRTEVADLLVDVSQTGLAAGLDFELFRPEGEVPREFYAELPIKLRVTGNYHQFGEFVSGLAALPRIVTIHNIVIKPSSNKGGSGLVLNATAKTYRYLDGEG